MLHETCPNNGMHEVAGVKDMCSALRSENTREGIRGMGTLPNVGFFLLFLIFYWPLGEMDTMPCFKGIFFRALILVHLGIGRHGWKKACSMQ